MALAVRSTAGYNNLPPFERTQHRLLDHDFERDEVRRLVAQYGIEDFEIGTDEGDATLPRRESRDPGPMEDPEANHGVDTMNMVEPHGESEHRSPSDIH